MSSVYESNIWKFYLFKIVSAMELTISIFVLFLLANKLSMTQVMTLETIFIAIVLLLEVPSGAFADLFGRKISLSLAMLCASISFVIFGIGADYWTFLAAQIFIAFGWALTSGADSALLYDSLKEAGSERGYARIFGRGNFYSLLTFAISALFSGFLAVYLGYRALFFITSFIFFAGFIVCLLFKEPPIHKIIHEKNYLKHLAKAIRFSYSNKTVKNLIIYFGMFAALGHLSWFLIQPFYEQSELPGYTVGIATFLYFITAALGNLTAERFIRRIKEERLLIIILLIASLSFIGIFFVNRLFALLLISIMSFVCGVRDILVNKGINEHTDSHHRATVVSIQSMSKSLMYAIFAPLIGYFTDLFSPSAAFLMMGIGLFLFFVYYLVLSLANRKSPAL
ncbi:MFS transporter [Candidatus Woesearchaeota archaeon]|nr:MFS transporter [Candidatus Woesearchaeota archaeon]